MGSQTDLDQGGTARSWVSTYLGPTIGWVRAPAGNVLPITAGGTFTLDPSVTLVEVASTAAVTIVLPTTQDPSTPQDGRQAGLLVHPPVVIVDVGGNAQATPITIKPVSVAETVMGLTQVQITVNFGGYTLLPNALLKTWNSISP